MIIYRSTYFSEINHLFDNHSIVALLGPRQCGKTTLANLYSDEFYRGESHHFDLEDPTDLAQLEMPKLALEPLTGLIIIDEIQRRPDLFPYLRALVDKKRDRIKLFILGSASSELIRQSSESLAGRIAYLELNPFSLQEVDDIEKLWLRGGFPLSYLATDLPSSVSWRKNYVRTFLERDIPSFGINIPPIKLERFWTMLAHYHGNNFNASELSKSLDISGVTARHYLEILTGVFMIRQLQPWHANLKKRQVKSPKIYFRDSGLLHSLLRIESKHDLLTNPKFGASWEGFALEQIIRCHQIDKRDCYFWGVYSGAELDLLVLQGQKKVGFEFKYTDKPKLTKSMQTAKHDLSLDELTLIFPGESDFALHEDNVRATGLLSYLRKQKASPTN